MTIGLIWDMDGVLVDSGEAHFIAWRRLFDEIGVPITAEQVKLSLGMSDLPLLRMWLGEDTPVEQLQELADRKEAYFRELVAEHVTLLPGIVTWLRRARAHGCRQAVASSAPMANITAIIDALGLADYFDLIIAGARLPASKPDPAIFVQAAQGLGCPADRCVVLEDSTHGVQAAHRAHIACLAITNTRSAADLAEASQVVDSLEAVSWEALERLVS